MKFGPCPVDEATGAILAHAAKLADGRLPKGKVLDSTDVARLKGNGVSQVIVARPDPGDLTEDEAATRLAAGLDSPTLQIAPAATGRVNIFAAVNGLFVADRAIIDRFNRVDPAITIATLADHVAVRAGDMVATIKIIPLAVAGDLVTRAADIIAGRSAFDVKPFVARPVGLVATCLPSLKDSVMDKTRRLTDQRLSLAASHIGREWRVGHRADLVAGAIRESLDQGDKLVIVFGASAVTDDQDVIPEAIRLAGGEVEQVGLPVDPGNLLVLGRVGDVPVIGAPGCARSPKENAFDWVLARILAGEHPDRDVLTGWGVGGLLMEIPTRPQPREGDNAEPAVPRVGIALLAAGQASRMGPSGRHKLLAEFHAKPLIRLMAERVVAAQADARVVVTGHRAAEIRSALSGFSIETIDNPDYASGMASSLKSGLAAMAGRIDGLMVMLADMPGVTTADLDAMIEAFRAAGGRPVIRAVAGGKRGNPVILPASTFEAIMKLEGDIGARPIIEKSGLDVVELDIGEAARLDVDTPEAILAAGGKLMG